MAHRSRWGWHPCDYQTYVLLKELNALCEHARRLYATWQRWHRKLPHNRVLRRKIVDTAGRRIGREVVGPWPVPPLNPLFCTRRMVKTYWSAEGKPLQEGRLVEEVVFDDRGIPEAYRQARMPMVTAEQVRPLRLSPEEVRRLAAEAGQ